MIDSQPAELLVLMLQRARMGDDGALELAVHARAWTGESDAGVTSSISIGLRWPGDTIGLLIPGGEGADAFCHVVTLTWPLAEPLPGDPPIETLRRLAPPGVTIDDLVPSGEGSTRLLRGRASSPEAVSSFVTRLRGRPELSPGEVAIVPRPDGLLFMLKLPPADGASEDDGSGDALPALRDASAAGVPAATVQALEGLLPQGARLDDRWIVPGPTGLRLQLTGWARSRLDVAEYLNRLEEDPRVTGLEVGSVAAHDGGVSFSLLLALPAAETAQLVEAEGVVQLKRRGEDSWHAAAAGGWLGSGDRLRVADGRARIRYASGEEQEVGASTVVELMLGRGGALIHQSRDEADDATDGDEVPELSVDVRRRADGTHAIEAVELESVEWPLRFGAFDRAEREAADLLSRHGSVVVDRSDGTLIARDSADRIAVIRARLAEIDVPRTAVRIEYRIVEVSNRALADLGFSATEATGWTGGPVAKPWTGARDLDALLQDLEDRGVLEVASHPIVVVQVGEEAEIESGVQLPVVSETDSEVNVTFVVSSLKVRSVASDADDGLVLDSEVAFHGEERGRFRTRADGSTTAVLLGPQAPGGWLVVFVTARAQSD
jgi:hypothetical protein